MEKEINKLSEQDISDILWLTQVRGPRLICNLYSISREQLVDILVKYSNSTIYKRVEADYS